MASANPIGAAAQTSLLARYAEFAALSSHRPLPASVAHAAKRTVVDWFAAMYAGAGLAPTTMLLEALRDELGQGKAQVYPGATAASPRTAALINATACHIAELDDIYREAIHHPGCHTVAAALALSQARGVDGEGLLRAIVVSFEIATRIGQAMMPDIYRHWHPTGTIGSIGAAAAGAAVLDLPPDRYVHALATGATLSAGLLAAFGSGSLSKPLHAGRAAEAGVFAAQAAEAGVTGVHGILESQAGFGHAFGSGIDADVALAGLGQDFNIERITYRIHSCCGHTVPAIDAVLALRGQPGFDPARIRQVTIKTNSTAFRITNRHDVRMASEARFSMPYVVAAALLWGKVGVEAFEDDRLADPQVQALLKRVALQVEPEFDAIFPARRYAHVMLDLDDGTSMSHLQTTRRGDPEDPLSDAVLSEKFLSLAVPVLGQGRAAALLERLWRLDHCTAEEVAGLGSPA